MSNVKPFVTLACICEKALQEKDDVLSIIRMVDVFYLRQIDGMPSGVATGIEFTVAVSLKSGQIKGTFKVGIVVRLPSGQVNELMEPQPVLLKGDEHGTNVVVRVILEAKEYGLYWFDVLWEGEVLTSIPLRLKVKADDATQEQLNLS